MRAKLNLWSYYGDFVIFPVMIFATALMVCESDTLLFSIVYFSLGLLLWSLFEYLFHRWGFHQFIFFDAHYRHHAHPAGYVSVSSTLTTTAYVVLIGLILFSGTSVLAIVQVGFSSGYLAYILVHHQIHHGQWSYRYLESARIRHNRHHHQAGCNFGVTVDLWDRLFGTSRPS
jgi:cyclopropane-fatty-acyl-phospholipid synthase